MIKAVIFDFFGVLVTEGFKQFQLDYFSRDEQKRLKAVELINQVDSGHITMDIFTSELAQLAKISEENVKQELGGNKPNKHLINYIRDKLHERYKISILSNSSMDFPRQILNEEDVKLFDDIVLSYRYGMVKPQAKIYELAAVRIGINPIEAVFIDDSQGHVVGAEAVGMKAIYYEDFPQFKKELEKLLHR